MSINLERYSADTAEPVKMTEIKRQLEKLLSTIDTGNETLYQDLLNKIIHFQNEDGTCSLVDNPRKIQADAQWDFCVEPTIICSSILMKVYISNHSNQDQVKEALRKGLAAITRNRLEGHGYEAMSGQIKAMKYLIEGGLDNYMENHGEICRKFTKMISDILLNYQSMLQTGKTSFGFEDYAVDIKNILTMYYGKQSV